jgi:hypothetical protein
VILPASKQSGYPAARAAALKVHPHLARHFTAATPETDRELLPDLDTIEELIDVAFWASLRREETWTPRISLAFVAASRVDMPLVLERPVPLASQALTRLGPAADRPGIHLCVSREDGQLRVWGTTRNLPQYSFVVEVAAPGLLVLKHSRGDDAAKFVNVAVLQGDDVKVVDSGPEATLGCPRLITSLLGLAADPETGPEEKTSEVNILMLLADSMRTHGRGGSLLVVPADASVWQESILQPITYALDPPFRALVELMKDAPPERSRRRWQEGLRRAIDGVAGLTAVDGATIITDQYEVLAFGAKILRRPGWKPVERVIVGEPVEGVESVMVEPGYLGGTRHLSAVHFVHDQRDAISLVASQDGRFTVFGWSAAEGMVYAHRIETLLL